MTFGQKCRDWRVVKESFQEGVLKIHTKAESKNKQKKTKNPQGMFRQSLGNKLG